MTDQNPPTVPGQLWFGSGGSVTGPLAHLPEPPDPRCPWCAGHPTGCNHSPEWNTAWLDGWRAGAAAGWTKGYRDGRAVARVFTHASGCPGRHSPDEPCALPIHDGEQDWPDGLQRDDEPADDEHRARSGRPAWDVLGRIRDARARHAARREAQRVEAERLAWLQHRIDTGPRQERP